MDRDLETTPPRDRLTDAERSALERFRGGARGEAFGDLVRPHLGALRALAVRVAADPHWADDLVQETLLRAFGGLDRFRGEAGVRTWLFRILVRLSTEPRRWRRAERAAPLGELPDGLGPEPAELLIERELKDRLEEALERLTPRQRGAFHLRAVEGLDYRAIAELLDCSAGAARMLVLGARRQVIARLGRFLEP
jgi:RNA polymerase sigma-70 factor (ECF subfamily)